MENDHSGDHLHRLRERAEQIIARREGPLPEHDLANLEELLHEIGVRQVELELQNDELKRTQQELESSRNRYRELYDFAPIGYVTVDDEGKIEESNLQAAELLGMNRSDLYGTKLPYLMAPEDLRVFRACLKEATNSPSASSREVRFLVGPSRRPVYVELTANSIEHGPGDAAYDGGVTSAYRLSLTDISQVKRAEAELQRERANLERRVQERTVQLQTANQTLRKEIAAREEIEAKLRHNQLRLRSLAAELTNTEERERREVARYLHDLVAQTLAMAKMKLSSVAQRIRDEELTKSVHETETLVQEMIEATRGILVELSPPVLEEQDIPTAVTWLVDHLNEKYDLNVSLGELAPSPSLSEEKKRFLFRSLRELLLNVAQHAEAETVTVDLSQEDERLLLTVRDDGKGFNIADARKSSGFGIFSIQQRVEDLGGSFTLDSEVGRGTTSELRLPTGSE